ncbi:MAG: tetratricopeptide repeat protein [Isosphaerales bacterium]
MSRRAALRLVALLGAVVVCAPARASDPALGHKLNTSLIPRKSSRPEERASECVQRTPSFGLWDAGRKIAPGAAGHVYVVEQSDGNRLLLSDLTEGLRGWTPSGAVIPLRQAEPFFSQQITANPRSAFAFLMRGVVRYENDDLDHAVADVDEALRLDPKYVPALIVRGYLWQWRNRLDQALADLDKAIELDSRNSYAFVERGIFHYNMKSYDKALRDFEAAVDLGSRCALIYIGRGMIDLEKRDPKKAQAEFKQALELDPKHPDAFRGLASMFLMRGDTRKALAVLDQAVELDPQSPDSHGNRAVVLLSIDKYDKALEDLEEVLRFAPDSARALRERAWLLATCPDAKIRNSEQAVVSATRACELTGWNEPQCLRTLAAACAEAVDFAAAVNWQQKAIDLLLDKNPEKSECRRVLDRYKGKKPYRHVGLLEEMGLPIRRPAAKKGD